MTTQRSTRQEELRTLTTNGTIHMTWASEVMEQPVSIARTSFLMDRVRGMLLGLDAGRPKPQPRRPLLFLVGDDPVRLGLIVSLARSGGNMTGINLFADEIAAKRLNLHICARLRRTSSPL